jgi:hypothetical protein
MVLDCKSEPANWWDYIEKLKDCGVPVDYFGNWNNLANREPQNSLGQEVPTPPQNQPATSTPRFQAAKNTRSSSKPKTDNIREQFIGFMQEFFQSPQSFEGSSRSVPKPGQISPKFHLQFESTPRQQQNPARSKNKGQQARGGNQYQSRGGKGRRGGRGSSN